MKRNGRKREEGGEGTVDKWWVGVVGRTCKRVMLPIILTTMVQSSIDHMIFISCLL